MATHNNVEQDLDTSCPMVEKTDNALKNAGLHDIAVSALAPRSEETIELAVAKETMASIGAAIGASCGAVIGGAIGWLTGISLLSISDVGLSVRVEPIMAAFAGFAAGGLVGALGGALIGMLIPDLEARRYAGGVREGAILRSVYLHERDWGEKGVDRSMEMQLNRRETSENSERSKIHWCQGSVVR